MSKQPKLELTSCAFCRGPARIELSRPEGWRVQCDRCYARGEQWYPTSIEAAAQWNRWMGAVGEKMESDEVWERR